MEIVGFIEEDSPEGERLGKLFNLGRQMRGLVLDQAITLDNIVTDIIATHFCSDPARRALLRSDVVAGPGFSWSDRIRLLERLIDLEYGDWLDQHPKLPDRLHKIRRLRNRLAHSSIDSSPEFIVDQPTKVQFVFYDHGKEKTQLLTVDELNERLTEGTHVLLELATLSKEVRRASGTT